MPGSPQPDVSVVLPVFNEVGHAAIEIDRIRRAFDASPYSFEIIVIDDGSTDGSGELLDSIDGIRLLRFDQNLGCGVARRAGTELAEGSVVAWTDVDMSYPNERIPELVSLLEGHDQVVGAREGESGSMRLIRGPVKWFIRHLASYTVAHRIPDLNSGIRVFRRDVARQYLHLLPARFSCVTTITMTFLADGYSVIYVPVEYRRRAGQGKFHWLFDTVRYVAQVLRLGLRYRPLRILGPPGVAVASAGATSLILRGTGFAVGWLILAGGLGAVVFGYSRRGQTAG